MSVGLAGFKIFLFSLFGQSGGAGFQPAKEALASDSARALKRREQAEACSTPQGRINYSPPNVNMMPPT